MKITLMIEGSASALAAILASLPAGDHGNDAVTVTAGPTQSLPTLGAVAPPMPAPAPVATYDDDNEGGAVAIDAPAFDTAGLPWDERIHSKNKGTNQDGTWRKKRGVHEATIAAVETELRARAIAPAMPGNAPVPMPAPFPVPAAPQPMPAPIASAPLPTAAPYPAPEYAGMASPVAVAVPAYEPTQPLAAAVAQQPVPMPAPAPQPAPTVGAMEFGAFMAHISVKMTERDANGAPLIHADYLASLTAEIGGAFGQQLNAITDIASNPNMINFAVQALQRDGRW